MNLFSFPMSRLRMAGTWKIQKPEPSEQRSTERCILSSYFSRKRLLQNRRPTFGMSVSIYQYNLVFSTDILLYFIYNGNTY